MKQLPDNPWYKGAGLFLMGCVFQTVTWAQTTTVEIDQQEVGSWFSRNWMWVTGGVLLLVIILISSGGGMRSRRTTTTTNGNGRVRQSTTTEVDS